jgi:hypothetical protein
MTERDRGRFEDTLDILEGKREETEERFRDLLVELSDNLEALRVATERSAEIYRQRLQERRQALAAVKEGLQGAAEAAGPETEWPKGAGLSRRRLNGFLRWLLRDYLEIVDRRFDARAVRIDRLRSTVDRLHETVALDGEGAEGLHDLLELARRALQAANATHAEMLDLVNAKDAEVLQRAVAGPLRRMEVLFDEFARQQEGLLSQLVGRRRELDELVEAATLARKTES